MRIVEDRDSVQDVLDYSMLQVIFSEVKNKLVSPKIRIRYGKGDIIFSMNRKYNRFHDTVFINYKGDSGYEENIGLVTEDGKYFPYKGRSSGKIWMIERFLHNPRKMIYNHSVEVGKCSFCNKELTDDQSLKVGFGQTCSKNWGLHNIWLKG